MRQEALWRLPSGVSNAAPDRGAQAPRRSLCDHIVAAVPRTSQPTPLPSFSDNHPARLERAA
jgi:hypothetical protein